LKRYEQILLILKEFVNLTNEEVHFLFSVLAKEDVNFEATRQINLAKLEFPFLAAQKKRSIDEIELMEGSFSSFLNFTSIWSFRI
jgi:hypothetical protein